MRTLAALVALASPLLAAGADPAPPPPPWKAQAKAGIISTGGNAQTTTLSAGANATWTAEPNKVTLDGIVAYGRTGQLVVTDRNANGLTDPGEIGRATRTTANMWQLKGRYDRALTKSQGVFAGASVGADLPAGKTVIAGGQAGWAAKLVSTATEEVVAELGYDFSYEEYDRAGVKPVEIHSARAFLGHTHKLAEAIGVNVSVEALANLNEEKALDAHDLGSKVTAFEDLRVNGKLALTAALRKNVSLSVGFALRWDRNPAPLPPVAGAPPFAAGYFPFAKEVDTVTDAALIVTFL